MPSQRALIVGEHCQATRELSSALQLAGFLVRHTPPTEAIIRLGPDDGCDMLLVSASLGLRRIAVLSERLATSGSPPTTVVYPDGEVAALESCARAGFDYVTPPFLPSLLRSRLTSCLERGQLNLAVEEMATAASLRDYERDLFIAREIQQSGFLPDRLPTPRGWQIAAKFCPARVVAGDFYDAFELARGRRVALVVADVCDKGVGAALFMALIRTMLRNTAEQAGGWDLAGLALPEAADSPAIVASALAPTLSVGAGPLLHAVTTTNSYMARHHYRQGYFCTLFFAILDPATGTMLYVNGGHNPAVLVRADGHHALLGPTGPAVGMFAHSTFLLGHAMLGPGDALFIYTDGIPEARNPAGEFFGMNRTVEAVTRPVRAASELLDCVEEAVLQYVGDAEQHDDMTMLALRRAI
jgi:serine phosphatase RsbU (regulator of sigma subunit)